MAKYHNDSPPRRGAKILHVITGLQTGGAEILLTNLVLQSPKQHRVVALMGGGYLVDKLKTGLLDGKLSGITFFSEKILPLINSLEVNNQFKDKLAEAVFLIESELSR